jgi:hypothetical protein
MFDNPRFNIVLDPTVVVSEAEADELPLRRFNIVILVEPDTEWLWPTAQAESQANLVWEELKDELLNFADDAQDVLADSSTETSEIDIILARIGSASRELFPEVRDQAYVTFPQGIIQPYQDVLRHLGYWLGGVHKDHPVWRAVVVGAVLEIDVRLVANVAASLGIPTTILERYCIPADYFEEQPDHADRPAFSYGEITADKLSGPEQ